MKNITIMLKPVSSACNLRCRYCFYHDVAQLRSVTSYGVMPAETAERILDNTFSFLSPGDHITFAFQGGEPMLAGLDFYKAFTDAVTVRQNKVQVHYAIQTNGTLIDEDWAAFFTRHRILVGISLDILKDHHDSNRIDAVGNGTWKQVTKGIHLLREANTQYNILAVLTNSLARHPQQVWAALKRERVSHVQFIPCLPPLEGTAATALTPQRFAFFYTQLFRLWLADWNKGNYISIKLFDDVIHYLCDGIPAFCGMTGLCYPQIVAEADGSAYPCDFYVLDDHRLGDLAQQPLEELYHGQTMRQFQNRSPELPAFCGSCPYRRICGGGCKRMRGSMYCGAAEDFCGYRAFLDACGNELAIVARSIP